MIYYVYYDSYGDPREIVSEEQLAEHFDKNPDLFLEAVCEKEGLRHSERVTGHVGTLCFESEAELREYLDSVGEVVDGFFCCRSESRPYNF